MSENATPPAVPVPGAPDPAPDPGAAQPAAPDPGAAPPAAPSEPEQISMPKEAFDKRLEQATRAGVASALKELGFEDAAAAKAFKAEAGKAAKAAEEARRAEMTELEKYKADVEAATLKTTEAEARAVAAEEDAEASRIEAHVSGLIAARGIGNPDYAFFKLEQACALLEEGEDLDEANFLDQLVADEKQRAALGFEVADPTARPAETAAGKTGPDPIPAGPDGDFDAMTATPEEMRAHLQKLGA